MESSKFNYMLSQAMLNVKGLETTEKLGEENRNLPYAHRSGAGLGHAPGLRDTCLRTSERGQVLMRPAFPRTVFFTYFIAGLSL